MEDKINALLKNAAGALRVWAAMAVRPWRAHRFVGASAAAPIAPHSMLLGAALVAALVFERTAIAVTDGVGPAAILSRIADQISTKISWDSVLGTFTPLFLFPLAVGWLMRVLVGAATRTSASSPGAHEVRDLHLYAVSSLYFTVTLAIVLSLAGAALAPSLDAVVGVVLLALFLVIWSIVVAIVGLTTHAYRSGAGVVTSLAGVALGLLAVASAAGGYGTALYTRNLSSTLERAARYESIRQPAVGISIVDGPHLTLHAPDSVALSWSWIYLNQSDTLLVVNRQVEQIACGDGPWLPATVVSWSAGDGYAVLSPGGTAWMRLGMRMLRTEFQWMIDGIHQWHERHENVAPCRAVLHFAGMHDAGTDRELMWGPTSRDIRFDLNLLQLDIASSVRTDGEPRY